MTTYWKKKYVCRWPETAFRLAQGDIRKEYGVDVSEKVMKGTQIHHDVTEISVDMAEIMRAQVAKAQIAYVKNIETRVREFEAREQTETQRTLHRRQDARVIVQDMVTRAYGRERRTYVAEVELDGARISVTATGKDLTPKQHIAFKAALARAMHEGIVAE